MTEKKADSPVEAIKHASRGLAGGLAAQLADGNDGFGEAEKTIIRFHGFYQQKNRDPRKDEEGKALPRSHSFMIRGRIPGGRVTPAQYSIIDDLADRHGGGSIRLTTRQTVQFHGVARADLKPLIAAVNRAGLTTKGACGDVVRNVLLPANPAGRATLRLLEPVARALSERFIFRSSAYDEIWLDAPPGSSDEPFYGPAYLPRKFKIALTEAGNNSIDILANDLGFAATFTAAGEIEGYYVSAGGGMGMTFNDPATHPRLADWLGWIPARDLFAVTDAVVALHRDEGDRSNRRHARLKYILDDRGAAWVRGEVERRSGAAFENRSLPEWNVPEHLGWTESSDGTLSLGLFVTCGRLTDREGRKLKSTVAGVVLDFSLPVQFTADQNLVLSGIRAGDRGEIERRLAGLGVLPGEYSVLAARGDACVAFPTCPLAFCESERFLPSLIAEIDRRVPESTRPGPAPVIRMTGCPNGCARPYNAEIGIVGERAGGLYAIFEGGDSLGMHLGTKIASKVPAVELADRIVERLEEWLRNARPGERFGDFVRRTRSDPAP